MNKYLGQFAGVSSSQEIKLFLSSFNVVQRIFSPIFFLYLCLSKKEPYSNNGMFLKKKMMKFNARYI